MADATESVVALLATVIMLSLLAVAVRRVM